MKHILIFAAMAVFFSNCLYHDIKAPGPLNKGTVYNLTSEDFRIVKPVTAEGETTSIFFYTIVYGGDGWEVIQKETEKAGGDDFMNFHMDLKSFGILGLYEKTKWKARATVIKYLDKVKN